MQNESISSAEASDPLLRTARETLTFIENRTIHVLSQLQTAVSLLLNRQTAANLVIWDESLRDRLTVDDLNAHLKHWQFLIPADLSQRAALIHALAAKYPFSASAYPQLNEAFGLGDQGLQQTYRTLFNQDLLSSLMLSRVSFAPAPSRPQNTVDQLTEMLLRNDMGSQLEWHSLRRGEVLFEQGDAGDSLYIVMEGLVRLTTRGDAEEIFIMELGRGEIVGEMALLTGENRTATVYAARDTQLCKLSKAGFDFLVKKHPVVMTQISIQMARRMSRQDRQQKHYNRPVTLTVVPLSEGTADFVNRLAAELSRFSTTIHLNRERVVSRYPGGLEAGKLDDRVDDYELVAWLNNQESQAQYVIYEADTAATAWTRRCIEQADRIILVAHAGQSPDLRPVETSLLHQQDARLSVRQDLVLLYPDQSRPPTGTMAWLTPRHITRHHHIALDSSQGIERLGRFLRGRAIGVVFGGGGMRGSAQVGAIRALHELGIRADFVGGTSIGSMTASHYALGITPEKMLETIAKDFSKSSALLDYTFPFVALTAAQRFNNKLHEFYGDLRLEDLWLNCFCVSTNLTHGKVRVHQQGLLRRAVRASTALPGIYPPVLDDNGDFLVDGGLINNVPVDVMKAAVDGGKVIAVDVSREAGRRSDYHFGDSISGWQVLFNRLNPFVKNKRYPSIIKTMIRASYIANDNTMAGKTAYMDLHLKPPVDRYGLFETAAYQAVYDIGYQYAAENIRQWIDSGGLNDDIALDLSESTVERAG